METMNIRHMDAEDKDLIAQFLLTKQIMKLPPAAAAGNEMSRATQDLVAKRRREYRKAGKKSV